MLLLVQQIFVHLVNNYKFIMSIISKQTGYSNDSNLLYAILKEVDDICKALGPTPTTTTTTTV